MDGLRFGSEAALAVAIKAGLVPSAVARRPIRFARAPSELGPDAAVVIDATDVTGGIRAALIQAGAQRAPRPRPDAAREAPFWLAIVRPTRAKDPPALEVVLFRVGSASSGLELAATLLGLGAERLELASFTSARGEGMLLVAAGASCYHVERALERLGDTSVFARVDPRRDDVWLELGWSHPDLSALRAPDGQVVLVDREGTVEVAARSAFGDAQAQLELEVERAPVVAPAPPSSKLVVPLRLIRGVRERAPQLWVLRSDGARALDRLAESASEHVLTGIGFLVSGEPAAPTVVLRSLPGAPPPLVIEGEPYAPLPELGDVYVPVGRVIHPPVAPHRLRLAIGGPDDRVRWLTERGGRVVVESAPISGFNPLSDWTEIAASKADLEPWVRNVSFEPEAFVVSDLPRAAEEPREARKPEARPKPPVARAPRARRRRWSSGPSRPRALLGRPRRPKPDREAPHPRTELDARLLAAEQAIGGSDEPLAAPSRDSAWLELGEAYAAAGLAVEARITFARAATSPAVGSAARRALLAMALAARGLRGSQAWPLALARDERGPCDPELLVALLLATGEGAPLAPSGALSAAASLIDEADARLDVRSAWLARSALADLCGGDPLLLARGRDRALARLERGLSLGRDLPRAVRALSDPRAAERVRLLGEGLAHFESTPRVKGLLEGSPEATLAYVRLVFACAIGRAGDAPRARSLLESALSVLPSADPVHDVLSRSFAARVQQALEQEVEGAPLPPETIAAIQRLGRLERYKVDRVRQASKLLEPEPDLDPFRSFGQAEPGGAAEWVTRVAHAPLPSDAAAILDEVAVLCEREADPSPRRERLAAWTAALAYAPRSVSGPRLEGVVRVALTLEPLDRVRAVSSIVALAERLRRHDLAALLVGQLTSEVAELPISQVASVVPHVVRGAGELRRGPSRAELERLYRRIGSILGAARDTPTRVARLVLLKGLAEIGAVDGALELDADVALLETGELSPSDRLQLARGVAACASALGMLEVVRRVAALWRRMTDSYNTNSHLCLSAVELADCVAWALTPRRGDRASLARSMADDDEQSVRALVFGAEG